MIAVAVQTAPVFIPGKAETLFRGMYVSSMHDPGPTWDVSPDGKRFLMLKDSGGPGSASAVPHKIDVVLNWLEELKQRVK